MLVQRRIDHTAPCHMIGTIRITPLLTILVTITAPALLCGSPEVDNAVIKVPPHLSTALPDCDRVEILLLGELQERPGEGLFPIEAEDQGSDARYARILSRKTLDKPEAVKLCGLWRSLTFDLYSSAKEQSPDYGLRFYRKDRLEFQTSIGFRSQNFTYTSPAGVHSLHGFELNENSTNLHKFLKVVLPSKKEKKPGSAN